MDGWIDRQMERKDGWMDGKKDGWIDRRMDRRMDRRADGQTDRQIVKERERALLPKEISSIKMATLNQFA